MRSNFRTLAFSAAISTITLFPLTHHPFIAASAWAESAPAGNTTTPADARQDVPVKAVTLYSSGVGYFQHSGTITGNASAVLPFKVDQINDVLKSLLLQDKGGQVTGVTYASQDPLAKTLKSFQVNITDNPSLEQLLNQLRGAKVTVSLQGEQVTGTVLGVEKRSMPAGENKTVDVAVLNLFNGSSMREISIPDIHDIHIEDPELRDELTKALAAVASARDQDKRPVTIHFAGQGPREVVIGYVVETPVWKTSYRLVLGDKEDAKLQGWAIVENQTDNDWTDVQLSLVSGRPISFIENLYEPLYNPRPTVQPQLYSSLQPRVYEEGNVVAAKTLAANAPAGLAMRDRRMDEMQMAMQRNSMDALKDGAAAASPINPTSSVISAASAAKLGELFQYTVGSVTLPRQSSSMIPIVTDSIHAQRVSIYNPSVMPRNPLNGAKLKNTTGKHLLGGPLTILDAGAYAGDSQIDNLPPDQDRLISFGIDLQMLVDTTNPTNTDDIVTGKIVKGVLEVTHKMIAGTQYDIQNKSDHDKTLILEHTFRPGWTLTDTATPDEKTDSIYRFNKQVPTGKTAQLIVKEQLIENQEYAIGDLDVTGVIAYSRTGSIPKDVKDALQKAADMKQAIADSQTHLEQAKQSEAGIVQDQTRINETLRTIDRTTSLYTRLLQKLNDQETALEKLRSDEDSTQTQINNQTKTLTDYLNGLNVG